MEGVPSDEFKNVEELMNFDIYSGLCDSPSTIDRMIASFALSPLQSMPTSQEPFDEFNGIEQNSVDFPILDVSSYHGGNSMMFQLMNIEFDIPTDSVNGDDSCAKRCKRCNNAFQQKMLDTEKCVIARRLAPTLAEKMVCVLSVFKESHGGSILAQIWVPIKRGNLYVLSTCDQPYLLDQMLAGYREVSAAYTFNAEAKPGYFLDVPGRVFTSKIPEWTSNVVYYNKAEYLRVWHSVKHKVRGSIALPIFEGDPLETSCCAVLEFVTMKEKANFDLEMENVFRALQAMNLRSNTPPRLYPQCFSKNQRAALAEITNVLQAVCHAHRLPLALTWIPCYTEVEGDKIMKVRVRGDNTNVNGKCILCIEDTACYVNDRDMQGFVHACAQNYLEEGQGIVGKALESYHPFFFSDVKDYDISEYPVVHHARKFGLNAAVAIRLRSTYTGDDDYILELFLPLDMKVSTEQQHLLNNLSCTMHSICKSLRTVSDAEVVGAVGCKVGSQKGSVINIPPVASSGRTSQQEFDENLNSIEQMPLNESGLIPLGSERAGPTKQIYPLGEQAIMEIDGLNNGKNVVSVEETHITGKKGTRKTLEREFGKLESSISFDDLKLQFGRKLEDAAENLGISRSTLKRIIRKHGIPRWPSHKRNKYNCSSSKLKDINGSIGAAEKSTCPASFAAYPFPAIDSTSQLASMNCSTQHIQRMNQDVSIFTIKATHGKVMIKFRFSSISGLVFLEGEVAKRLKLKSGSFIIQYQDSDNDCILIACDEDLFDVMDDAKLLGSTTVRLSVEPIAS